MRVVESTLTHFPKRRFGLVESIFDERVVAPDVNKRVLFCANKKTKKMRSATRSKQISRVRANRPKKKGETNTYLC
jgi:hypothetical protein